MQRNCEAITDKVDELDGSVSSIFAQCGGISTTCAEITEFRKEMAALLVKMVPELHAKQKKE